MDNESLGLIETMGLVPAIEAADAGSKAANVIFRGYQRGRAGLITVSFLGDVSAVGTAVNAGAAAAKRVGTVVSVHVIARPDRQLHVSSNGSGTPPSQATAAAEQTHELEPAPSNDVTAPPEDKEPTAAATAVPEEVARNPAVENSPVAEPVVTPGEAPRTNVASAGAPVSSATGEPDHPTEAATQTETDREMHAAEIPNVASAPSARKREKRRKPKGTRKE
jgi:microcompartment protein CcmL/EutN